MSVVARWGTGAVGESGVADSPDKDRRDGGGYRPEAAAGQNPGPTPPPPDHKSRGGVGSQRHLVRDSP
ncbi:MAG: hypothetical protein ACKOJF_03200, partial [Planctomycetaceae bacterium]